VNPPAFRIRLGKEDFKFSAAHFTLFPDGRAELLHGHNYRVRLELAGAALSEIGLLFDVTVVKRRIRERCAALDEHTLIPVRCDRLDVRRENGSVQVRFRDRVYRFPERDVVLLPLANVSIELLARMLWNDVAEVVGAGGDDAPPVDELTVEVEETPGQSCAFTAPLPP
jgi:6-pyruvoyltetrahydropterin/6-carboxytetrahydropterin synthase